MELQSAKQFGRYQLVSRLGRGGMAETYRSRLLGAAGITREVLIKRVLPEHAHSPDFTTMFIREARICASLSHGNIAQLYDFGCVDGEYFLAMEYVDGQPLNRVLKRALRSGFSAMPVPLALLLGSELCRGLHYAHTRVDEQGQPLEIVHRDISPDNVLLSYEGQVKIVDFGIAKSRDPRGSVTEPGIVKGKYLYFAPEQARGELVDARADVWATGVVLYKLLCGKLPVEAPEYLAVPRLVNGEFPHPRVINPELPLEVDAIVMKALSVQREQRYESCQALGEALTEALRTLAPKLPSQALACFMQELFGAELRAEGRPVHVPRAFQEQLAQWRGATVLSANPLPEPPAAEVVTAVGAGAVGHAGAASRLGAFLGVGLGSAVVGAALALLVGHALPQPAPVPPPVPLVLTSPEARLPPPPSAPERLVAAPVPVQPEAPAMVSAVAAAVVPALAPVAPVETTISSEAEALSARASRALQRKEWRTAVGLGEKCIKASAGLAECYLSAAEGYMKQKRPAPQWAISRYTTFLKLAPAGHPQLEEARRVLKDLQGKRSYAEAEKLLQEGEFRQALTGAQQCLSLDSGNADCHLLAAQALSAMGYQDKAAEYYRRLMDVAPEHESIPKVRALLASYESRTSRRR